MPNDPLVILSYNAVSPLGIDLEDQWQRALCGTSGIGPLSRFDLTDNFPVRIAGQAPSIDHLSYDFLKPREQARWPSPIFKYALLTVSRALEKSGIEITPDIAPRVAVTFSTAIGGLDAVLGADRNLMARRKLPPPFVNPNACINMVGGKVSMHTGATGPITATISACATGVTSIIVGAMLINDGRADAAICGAVDFPLTEPIVAGFGTMGGAFMPKEGEPEEPPEQASRPFSRNRRGFVVSEGSGCIIIAKKSFADAHGLGYASEIAGWAMTSDAFHHVAPNLETVRRCITQSIEHAGIAPDRISAVNAHAASTRVGDQVEADALRQVFGSRVPPVTANKSMIGHSMGAASAIESILAIKGMQESMLPPTINYTPDPAIGMDCVVDTSRRVDQEYVLKNAFGFGGCNACMVFRRRDS
ncbi:MAG: beta-ketoacyl-[acyl-carrier-protein] synthase family protein [Desulfosarcina sp.]|nr:beta-ketoacyl-[acyl-carrier-protein] synthase family protein [Desulfosarcina sp.]MBC2765463.1 beta-ketoacyl-[acyl-carrier-protein] synthase family protein [Desulfosarcina sp.]